MDCLVDMLVFGRMLAGCVVNVVVLQAWKVLVDC
jgi:hypothetical protein